MLATIASEDHYWAPILSLVSEDSLGFAVAVGSGGSAGICLRGGTAAPLAPGAALVRLGA
jgi:hypothetical protein